MKLQTKAGQKGQTKMKLNIQLVEQAREAFRTEEESNESMQSEVPLSSGRLHKTDNLVYDPLNNKQQNKLLLHQHRLQSIADQNFIQTMVIPDRAYQLEMIQMSSFEKITHYNDSYPLLYFRKQIWSIKAFIVYVSTAMVRSRWFDNIVLAVILWNTYLQTIPADNTSVSISMVEWFFIIFYTIEMFIKMCAMGVLFNKGSYLRDYVNLLDILIVITSWIPIFYQSKTINLQIFRTLRVLRPLRTIKNIKALRRILMAIIKALPLLKDTMIIQWFNYLIFAIIGLQLMKGCFKQKCFNQQYGLESGLYSTIDVPNDIPYCKESSDCNNFYEKVNGVQLYICGKQLNSPKWNTENYDDIFHSFVQVYQTISLEGWSDIMMVSQKTFNFWIFLYYWLAIFIGSHYLLNLTVAVLGTEFQQAQEKIKELESQPIKQKKLYESWPLKNMMKIGVHKSQKFKNHQQKEIKKKQYSILSHFLPKLSFFNKKQVHNKVENNQFETNQEPSDKSDHQQILTHQNDELKKENSYKKRKSFDSKSILSIAKNMSANIIAQNSLLKDIKKQNGTIDLFIDQLLQFENNDYFKEPEQQLKIEEIQYDYNEEEKQQDKELEYVQFINRMKKMYLKIRVKSDVIQDFTSEDDVLKNKRSYQMRFEEIKMERKFRLKMFNLHYHTKYSQYYKEKNKKNGFISQLEDEVVNSSVDSSQIQSYKGICTDFYQQQLLNQIRKNLPLKTINRVKDIKSNYLQTLTSNQNWNRKDHGQVQPARRKSNILRKFKSKTYKIMQNQRSLLGKNKQSFDFEHIKQLISDDQLQDQYIENQLEMIQIPAHKLKQIKDYGTVQSIEYIEKQKLKKEDLKYQMNFQDQKLRDFLKDGNDLQVFWSGDDVFRNENIGINQKLYIQKRFKKILKGKNYSFLDIKIWLKGLKGIKGYLNGMHNIIYRFTINQRFDALILLCVCINTMLMALDGSISDPQGLILIDDLQTVFTFMFLAELIMKNIAIGPRDYVRDKINIFDAVLVTISLVEYFLSSGEANSGFGALRALRIFRVLRVTRLIRSLKYMRVIIRVLNNTIGSAMIVGVLLILFIFVYAILGMEIYRNKLVTTNGPDKAYRQSFDDFIHSFFAIFQMMTVENWNNILTACLVSPVSVIVTVLYLISCQYLLAYTLHNLFQAILVQGFEDSSILQEEAEELYDEVEVYQQQHNRVVSQEDVVSEEESVKSHDSVSLSLSDDDYMEDKPIKKKAKPFHYFEDIKCNDSLFLFSQKNTLRRIAYRIIKHSSFDSVIIGFIILSSIKLALDSYIPLSSSLEADLAIVDQIFTYIFIAECVLKVLALGFVYESGTYLRDSWNQLDFTIVCFSLVEIALSGKKISFLKVIRLTRVLRPLRFISRNQNMKLVVIALLESFGGIANVVVVILLCWVMIAILGINFVKKKMGYCELNDDASYFHISQSECISSGHSWKTFPWNMDDIIQAMLSIFVFATLEGWNDLVYNYLDSNDSIYGPIFENRMWILTFNLCVIYLSAFFIVDLFVGVIFLNYVLAEEKMKDKNLSSDQIRWLAIQRQIVKEKDNFSAFKQPNNCLRKYAHRIISYRNYFDNIIMLVIFANIIIMCMTYDDIPITLENELKLCNNIFGLIFLLECLLKLFAMGVYPYLYIGANVFDFSLVIMSVGDYIMDHYSDDTPSKGSSALSIAPQIARIFRVLRVTRVFKLIKSFKGLSDLIQTTILLLPAMLNVLSLTFLMLMIFAVLATQLFKDIQQGRALNNDTVNFKNFGNSFIMMFRMSTGEDWHLIMYDCMDVNVYNQLFFIFYVVLIQYIMMNLFVLVILREFDEHFYNTHNPLNQYKQESHTFKTFWNYATNINKGLKIHNKLLVSFIIDLPKPLGFEFKSKVKKTILVNKQTDDQTMTITKEEVEETQQEKKIRIQNHTNLAALTIMKMNISTDPQGYVYFNEILFLIMKRYYQNFYKESLTIIGSEIIQSAEELTLKKLQNINRKQYKFSLKQQVKQLQKISSLKSDLNIKNLQRLNTINSLNVATKKQTVNPLVSQLYSSMCFRAWLKCANELDETENNNSEYIQQSKRHHKGPQVKPM